MVPRPPTRTIPNRRKGTESVTTLGVMSRMTMTSDGVWGMSFDDIVKDRVVFAVELLAGELEIVCGCCWQVDDVGDRHGMVVFG